MNFHISLSPSMKRLFFRLFGSYSSYNFVHLWKYFLSVLLYTAYITQQRHWVSVKHRAALLAWSATIFQRTAFCWWCLWRLRRDPCCVLDAQPLLWGDSVWYLQSEWAVTITVANVKGSPGCVQFILKAVEELRRQRSN